MGKQKCLLTFAHLSLHSLKSTPQHCHCQHLAFYCLRSTNVLQTTLSRCLTSLSCHIFNAAHPLVPSTTLCLHSVLIQSPVPQHISLLIYVQCLSKTTRRLPYMSQYQKDGKMPNDISHLYSIWVEIRRIWATLMFIELEKQQQQQSRKRAVFLSSVWGVHSCLSFL